MRSNITWQDGRVIIDPPKRPKKITGTRFPSVLGANRWESPFAVWCEITKAYNRPFEGNKYTEAGQILEPKVMTYLERFHFGSALVKPTDIYGEDPFKATWGDFFKKESRILGGMWDALVVDDEGFTVAVVEIKTTKRVEDWVDGAPPYYEMQAALYAHLLGVDTVYMVGVFLEDDDYDNIEQVEISSDNCVVYDFSIEERFPDFQRMVDEAIAFWDAHVVTGISPEYDEKLDAEYLRALRTEQLVALDFSKGIQDIIAEAETLEAKIADAREAIEVEVKRLKELESQIKEHMETQLTAGSNRVEVDGGKFKYELLKTTRTSVDTKRLKDDGLFEKYAKYSDTLRLTKKPLEAV